MAALPYLIYNLSCSARSRRDSISRELLCGFYPLVKHLQKRASGGYEPAEKWHEMESRASMTARLFAVYSPSSIFLNSFSFSIQSIGVSRFRSRSSRASLILPAVGSTVSKMLSW